VKICLADPDRVGVGGWSYGGIRTDYLIASDGRCKAAISGAGSANQISMYGVDEYIFQYNAELGPPWKNLDAWVKLSYPFLKQTGFIRRRYLGVVMRMRTCRLWAERRCIKH
jgi:hypothetical protein